MASAFGTRRRENRKFSALRNFNYTTRANISHEEAEQIRARKPARPLKKVGGRGWSMCADGIKSIFFLLSVGGIWVLYGRGDHWSPAKKHKATFLLSYFCMTKSTKSHLRGLSSLLKNTLRVHELVTRSSAWRVRAAKG